MLLFGRLLEVRFHSISIVFRDLPNACNLVLKETKLSSLITIFQNDLFSILKGLDEHIYWELLLLGNLVPENCKIVDCEKISFQHYNLTRWLLFRVQAVVLRSSTDGQIGSRRRRFHLEALRCKWENDQLICQYVCVLFLFV